jgi:AraC-like DNA-binding protein
LAEDDTHCLARRIERAKTLLASSSVTKVALAVGFTEPSSFSAVFRRAMALLRQNFAA